jgi:spermidine/putrescine transport system substrate-binding protein
MKTNNLLQKLDPNKLPNVVKNIDPAVSAKKRFDPKNEWAVPYFLCAAGITVNKEKIGAFDKSWSIFERADLKGKMTLLDDPREVIGAALVVNGFSPNSVNKAEIAKAEATINKWKVNIKQFDSGTFQEGFLAGSLLAVHTYAENVWTALDEKQDKNEEYANKYEFFIPKEGNVAYMDTMVMMKDAPSKDLAYAFINFVHRADINARIADNFRIPCVNIPARALLKRPPNYDPATVAKCILKEDVGEGLNLYEEAWTRIKTGL